MASLQRPAARATYKRPAEPFPPHARPSSPESPAYELLSPARPVEPVFNYPALAQSKSWSRTSPGKPSQQLRNGRVHHRSPSAIEALADAALSTSPQPPQYRPSPAPYPHPDTARATKRARSDAGPLPHPYPFPGRPASSHQLPETNGFLPTYNLDRQRRQSTNTTIPIPNNPLEDAELLLNFASRVAPRPVVAEAQTRPPVLAPSALPPPPPPLYPTFTASVSRTPHIPVPVNTHSSPLENPSASLPSPQGTNEDDKSLETEKETQSIPAPLYQPSDHAPPPFAAVPEPQGTLGPQQTHTPPEEERLALDLPIPGPATATRQDGIETWPAQAESQQTPEAPAARPRRGWPKGKPRGPRNKTSTAAKPRSSTRRSRASTAKSNTESGDSSAEEKRLVRRKSDSALPLFNVAQPQPRQVSVPPSLRYEILALAPRSKSAAGRKSSKEVAPETICASCSQTRESNHGELDQWISCNGCKLWFHFDCAGFKNERDVRDVDKFFCKACEPQHGPTTFVRKSSRAHAAVDYAGLNQGILKTSDDNPEHHYIQPIKDGTFTFDPETFPRMRPELVTRNFFETCTSFSEPVVIPADFNPKLPVPQSTEHMEVDDPVAPGFRNAQEEEGLTRRFEYEPVLNDGQDRLDMVVPHGLTVRHVAQLVGPDVPLEVIDVKTQGTEGKWNLQKWADYYEADGEKTVRNVISLEVSGTKLGRLLRRPKVVRDIDLQDSVWPGEETAKGNYPKVQFYCLMSVADSFTDFHIDFGGSSVYYHILRGKKTFFFIPPKPGHLKKYEDWNNSHEQNFTWLPDSTKECYRVDLSEGDTMLIPSGWIHAVWTPENSLVIGGNFLTRMHYSTQFRIVDIEKAIKTPQKFRYPHFQKVMWYSVIKYLETDPLPAEVAEIFYSGAKFPRERPIWQEFDTSGAELNHLPGTAGYNARYYSQAELEGLPELIKFIFRTVMISFGKVEGVTEDTRKKVRGSIPKSYGEPLELAKTFALWVAWKRGNEDPPAWAHPEADLPDKESAAPKKLSARALKMMQRQEAFDAYKIAPERHSTRQQASREENSVPATSPAPSAPLQSSQTPAAQGSQHTSTPKTSVLGPKRVACDACRKRRIKCKHKDVVTTTSTTTTPVAPPAMLFRSTSSFEGGDPSPADTQRRDSRELFASSSENTIAVAEQPDQMVGVAPVAQMTAADGSGPALIPGNALLADPNSKRGRSKACLDCRKSKRRCIHDETGKIDPVKAEQTPVPRGSATSKKRRVSGDMESPSKRIKQQSRPSQDLSGVPFSMGSAYQPNMVSPQQYKPHPYQEANIPHWQHENYLYPDPTDADGTMVATGGPYHQQPDPHASYNAQSLEQLANEVLDTRFVNDGDYTVPHPSGDAAVHPALQQSSAPSHDAIQVQQVFPHVEEAQQNNNAAVTLPNGSNVEIETAAANSELQRRPSASDEFSQAPRIDSLNDHLPFVSTTNGGVSAPQINGFLETGQDTEIATGLDKQTIENTLDGPAPAVQEPVTVVELQNNVNGHPAEVNSPLKETVSSLTAAPKVGLNNIPLYEPPPSVVRRSTSQVPRQTAGVNPEVPSGHSRRSLSRTPAPPVQTIEQKTPGSRKRKADSTTPSTTKSRKMEHMPREMSAVGEEDEQSIRLARELQDQDWGLRRRSRQLG